MNKNSFDSTYTISIIAFVSWAVCCVAFFVSAIYIVSHFINKFW